MILFFYFHSGGKSVMVDKMKSFITFAAFSNKM